MNIDIVVGGGTDVDNIDGQLLEIFIFFLFVLFLAGSNRYKDADEHKGVHIDHNLFVNKAVDIRLFLDGYPKFHFHAVA